MSTPQQRRFVILADGAQHVVTRTHHETRRLDDDLVYHDFYTADDDRVRYSQSDIDRIDELLIGEGETEGKLLRKPLWPTRGEAAPEAVHGHELPARWRDLGSIEMAGLAERVGVDLSALAFADRTSDAIRVLILDEIDWVKP